MKTLYLECKMGAAGDMLMGALLELHPAPEDFLKRLNALCIPGAKVQRERSEKCGLTGTHMKVTINGVSEHAHSHEHHIKAQEHHHTGMQEISHIVEHLSLPEKVRGDILAVYRLIAEAESAAHGRPVEEIHFHEVGAMDAVADITGVCMLMDELAPKRVVVSPVSVGSGQVHCAHGILPVPAPATAYLLREIPIQSGNADGELCTPTGAALLKYFADDFGELPAMRVSQIGYGMGTKDFAAANCLRAMLGESGGGQDEILELACNLDDMTPEEIAFAAEQIFKAGALDVYTAAIGMKKGRPGMLLSVLCKPEDRERMTKAIFHFTTTIGIREYGCNRHRLERTEKVVKTPCGEMRMKCSEGYGVSRRKAEYDDAASIAERTQKSLREIRAMAEKEQ